MTLTREYQSGGKLVLQVIALFLSSLSLQKAAGQEKLNITGGAGFLELFHAGFRWQWSQVQIGASVGFAPVKNENVSTLSADIFYHFEGRSPYSERRLTYLRLGVIYFKDVSPYFLDRYTYLNLRIGRDLNISDRVGFNIDGGLLFELYHQQVEQIPDNAMFNTNVEAPVLPSASVGVFYRLK